MKFSLLVLILASLSVALAIAAFVLLLLLPVYSGVSVNPDTQESTDAARTLIQMNGYRVLIPMALPVVFAAGGLLGVLRMRRGRHHAKLVTWVSTVLLIAFVFIAGFSIGDFYAPAALVMMVAAGLSEWKATVAEDV